MNYLKTLQNNALATKRISSVTLVNLINEVRAIEGITKKREHADIRKKIRKEMNGLLDLGREDVAEQFSEGFYLNAQNKKQPCYIMSVRAVKQILVTESLAIRTKVLDEIEELQTIVTEHCPELLPAMAKKSDLIMLDCK